MASRILHQRFLGVDFLEDIIVGECCIAGWGLVKRAFRTFTFALDQQDRRLRIGNALDRRCFP